MEENYQAGLKMSSMKTKRVLFYFSSIHSQAKAAKAFSLFCSLHIHLLISCSFVFIKRLDFEVKILLYTPLSNKASMA
jgi:hypothetical protein